MSPCQYLVVCVSMFLRLYPLEFSLISAKAAAVGFYHLKRIADFCWWINEDGSPLVSKLGQKSFVAILELPRLVASLLLKKQILCLRIETTYILLKR